MTANFKPVNLRLVDPPFGLRLVTLILELDYLRKKPLGGTTHPLIFFQLKNIFHLLESIGSARIEGNQTTLAEYIEGKIEGSKSPGDYRKNNVVIGGFSHTPPDASTVPSYMEELFNFINKADPPQYDLLKVAIVHHRFVWIHPFDNGNGRVVRLLTYAMTAGKPLLVSVILEISNRESKVF